MMSEENCRMKSSKWNKQAAKVILDEKNFNEIVLKFIRHFGAMETI